MKKQTIFFDAGPLITPTLSGIGHVTLGLLRSLVKRQDVRQNYRIVLLAPMAKAHLLDRWQLQGVEVRRVPLLARIWNVWPRFRWLPPIDLFFGKGIYIFPNYKRWPLVFSPSVTYVHDISFELFPQFTEPRNLAMLAHVPRWIRKSTLVVTDSQASKKEIITQYNVDPDKIAAIYCGIDIDTFKPASDQAVGAVKEKYGLTLPYLLFLSNIEPRKNIVRLLQGLQTLPKEYAAKYALLMVGGMSWHADDITAEMQRAQKQGWHIIRPSSYVPDQDLPALLTGAVALVHPALHEGFGIPPVEALACGTPVIASDIPVLREVLNGEASFVDPNSIDSIAAGIRQLLDDPKQAAGKQQSGIARARTFSWDAAAEAFMGYIKQIGNHDYHA